MKQGFLLQKSSSSSSKNPNKDLGPLHDVRINRIGWGGLSYRDTTGDQWGTTMYHTDTTTLNNSNVTTDRNAVSDSNTVMENPYVGILQLPFKTHAVPINALNGFYTQYYYATHIKMNRCYFSWSDNNPKSHLLRWTSIYVCPMNGELFMSGKWPYEDDIILEETNEPIHTSCPTCESIVTDTLSSSSSSVVIDTVPMETFQIRWMKTKKSAEHGAAAWAYDCFQHRHASQEKTIANDPTPAPRKEVIVTGCIGSEAPYLYDNARRSIPNYVPQSIRSKIEEFLVEIQNDTLKYGDSKMNDVDHEDELAWRPPINTLVDAAPMNALNCYYTQYYYATHIKMSNYSFSWNDNNPKSHLLRWTSIYVCPMNGELFISGKWPNNDDVLLEETNEPFHSSISTQMNIDCNDSIYIDKSSSVSALLFDTNTMGTIQIRWMKTKKAAEHGAAAWAYDCFQHRHALKSTAATIANDPTPIPRNDVIVTGCIGSEIPYLYDKAIRTIPRYVPETIRRSIEKCLLDIKNDTLKYGEVQVDMDEKE